MMRLLSYATLLIFSVVVVGCSKDTADDSTADGGSANDDASNGDSSNSAASNSGQPSGSQRFGSPKEAYAAFAKAAKANDIASMVTMLSDESQREFAGGFMFQASFSAGGDEAKEKSFAQLLARHGVDLDAEPEPPADGEPSGPDAMMAAMAKPIKDIPAFVKELEKWIKENTDDFENPFAELGELGEVKIDGDKAQAIIQTDFGPQPFEFHKVDGGWLVHLSSEPPEGIEIPEDDTTPFGTIFFDNEVIPLRHALAYKWKLFDDPCTVIVMTSEPVYDRDMKELKEMLAGELGEGHFFASGPRVELTLNEEGKLMSMFAWVDNNNINTNSGVEVEANIEADRVVGSAMMIEASEINGKEFQFDANFDAEIVTKD